MLYHTIHTLITLVYTTPDYLLDCWILFISVMEQRRRHFAWQY